MEMAEGVTLTDSIAERLIQFIARNQLKPGDSLPSERQLTTMLKVSRLPLREALARLRALGIIAVRQGKGAVVCPVNAANLFRHLSPILRSQTPLNFAQMMEVRLALEPAVARLAAQRRSAEDLAALQDCVRGMQATLTNKAVFIHHDMEFHRRLATATGNPTFEVLVNTIHHLVSLTQWGYEDHVVARELSLRHHQKILATIEHRAAAAAEAAMTKHLEDVALRLTYDTPDEPGRSPRQKS